MIYLKLMGRIGNQLFMYAAARALQKATGDKHKIVIEDCHNVAHDNEKNVYENSLQHYSLKNVEFVHDYSLFRSRRMLIKRIVLAYVKLREKNKSIGQIRLIESREQKFYNAFGIFFFTYGYHEMPLFNEKKDIYLRGYFQSEKFFNDVKDEIIKTISCKEELDKLNYPELKEIESRNTVCISIKVQHNVGNSDFDVCSEDYYKRAIELIKSKVEKPLFFVCSDNVDYVMNNLLNLGEDDVIKQDPSLPVHLSLAVMGRCKHFIIGNTSFGWWAQYISDYSEKIVITPSRWYNNQGSWQFDIYQDMWTKIEI